MGSIAQQPSAFQKLMDLISGSEYGEPPRGVARVLAVAFTAILLVAFTVVGFLGVMAGLGGQP